LIRKNATAEFGILRRNLRPDTTLETVVPQSTRRESWQTFQMALGVAELPELVRPHTVNLTITVLVLSGIVLPVWVRCSTPPAFRSLDAFWRSSWFFSWLGFGTADETNEDRVSSWIRQGERPGTVLGGKLSTANWKAANCQVDGGRDFLPST
jgi:hypothetical protein